VSVGFAGCASAQASPVDPPASHSFAAKPDEYLHSECADASPNRRYRTPLLVFKTVDGYAFVVGYGLETDWVKNVLAGGSAVLHERGRAVTLVNPWVMSKAEAAALVLPRARLLYRALPYDEAAVVLTSAGLVG